jgi:hypothetical protein
MRRVIKFLTTALLLIVFFEPFGDSLLMNSFTLFFNGDISIYDTKLKLLIISIFSLIMIFSVNKVRINKILHLPIIIIITIYLYGLIWGMWNNNYNDSLNEISSIFPIFLIFILPQYLTFITIEFINKTLFYLIVFLFIKFLLYQFLFYLFTSTLAWKVLMKQSPFLLFPLVYYIQNWFTRSSIKNTLPLILTIFLLIIAQARTLIICAFFLYIITLFLSKKNVFQKVYHSLLMIFIVIFSFIIYLYSQNVMFIDSFEYLVSGDYASESIEFRKNQFNEIVNRLMSNPILGKGFGYYNPNYSTYSENAKPYLLELDLFNFLSKIGIPMFLIYISSYFLFYYYITKIKNINHKMYFKLYFWALISLLIYSLGQTAHSSYTYWLSYSLVFSSLIISLKIQNEKHETNFEICIK